MLPYIKNLFYTVYQMFRKKYKEIILLFVFFITIFFSHWFWKVFEQSSILGFLLFIVSALLALDVVGFIPGKKRIFIYIPLIILGGFLMVNSFNSSLFKETGTERSVSEQRIHLATGINKIFANRGYDTFLKIQRNFFTNFDLNQYFFGGAPRYRNYATDFNKFPIFFLPLFLYGMWIVFTTIKKYMIFIVTTLVLFVFSSFTRLDLGTGIYSLFPVVFAVIVLGFYSLSLFIFNRYKKI